MRRLKSVERLRRARLIAAKKGELDPVMESKLNRLTHEQTTALIKAKRRLGPMGSLDLCPTGKRRSPRRPTKTPTRRGRA